MRLRALCRSSSGSLLAAIRRFSNMMSRRAALHSKKSCWTEAAAVIYEGQPAYALNLGRSIGSRISLAASACTGQADSPLQALQTMPDHWRRKTWEPAHLQAQKSFERTQRWAPCPRKICKNISRMVPKTIGGYDDAQVINKPEPPENHTAANM